MGEFIAIMFPSAGEAISKLSKSFPNIDQVKNLFKQLDFDNDGFITKAEMGESSHRFSPQEIDSIFALGDINDDGAIDLEEFIGVMYPSASTVVNRLRAKYHNMNEVKRAFAGIDKNGDGLISKEEMYQCDTFNSQEIEALFTLGDSNNDGEIDLEEFIGVLYPVVAQALLKFTKDIHNVEDARFLFKQLDKDSDGLLSQEELRKCGTTFSSKEIEALFAVGDINSDGEIDLNEFINVMCPGATTVISRISAGFNGVQDIKKCFEEMDTNCDGKISRCEMAQYSHLNEQEVNAVFELGDADRDGEIDLQEFIGVMTTSSPVAYKEAGEVVTVGDMEIYKVGEGVKCIIWCHDLAGFSGADRTRQLVDKLAALGYLILIPNFFGDKDCGSLADTQWVKSVSDWSTIRDTWVERIYPWLRDHLGVRCVGVVGTGWGAYAACRLASYIYICIYI
ncbi:calcium-binding protein LPS1-alpha-like [Eurytemora carolleeae]|uniref:calcium-binding protein LPS1-alpha-like n=1 Tax=Eurytemora carolleeae TaxID=1294199 RepID=UPI000C7608CD|nr:calcium-binding protein LPS1-alpha-like [Eurytemora carolleeae]|eukprot:XP_023335211.1 calcium-binding protein LPS1-alpha-like [Eurytemora affinis]